MLIRSFLLEWKIELYRFHCIWWPPPHYNWIKEIHLFTRKWNALQAWAFVHETCNYPNDGMLTEVYITGRHEFLNGGVSTHHGCLWI